MGTISRKPRTQMLSCFLRSLLIESTCVRTARQPLLVEHVQKFSSLSVSKMGEIRNADQYHKKMIKITTKSQTFPGKSPRQ